MNKYSHSRRRLLIGSSATLAANIVPFAVRAASEWPDRPIRLVVGYAAGDSSDTLARVFAGYMTERLGQNVIVENRAGANSSIAAEFVANAKPDGYTLLLTTLTTMVQYPLINPQVKYDPAKNFTYISHFDSGMLPLAVAEGVPAANLSEFVEYAKTTPMGFGTWGLGSYGHLIGAYFNKTYDTKMVIAHYRGGVPMWQDVAGGQIQAAVGAYSSLQPLLQAKRARAIAVPAERRSALLPDVATFAEQGFADKVFSMKGGFVVVAPAGLPSDIADRVAQLMREAIRTDRGQEAMRLIGGEGEPTSPARANEVFQTSAALWANATRELKLTSE